MDDRRSASQRRFASPNVSPTRNCGLIIATQIFAEIWGARCSSHITGDAHAKASRKIRLNRPCRLSHGRPCHGIARRGGRGLPFRTEGEEALPGKHWYYRVDHATERHRWYLREEREAASQAEASSSSRLRQLLLLREAAPIQLDRRRRACRNNAAGSIELPSRDITPVSAMPTNAAVMEKIVPDQSPSSEGPPLRAGLIRQRKSAHQDAVQRRKISREHKRGPAASAADSGGPVCGGRYLTGHFDLFKDDAADRACDGCAGACRHYRKRRFQLGRWTASATGQNSHASRPDPRTDRR